MILKKQSFDRPEKKFQILWTISAPCPSSASSDRTGCRSLWPAAPPASGWSSKRSSVAWRGRAASPPKTNINKKYRHCDAAPCQTWSATIQHAAFSNRFIFWNRRSQTLMFCESTLALASSSRLMTVVLPASTAQCSAVFLWYLSPRFTDTLKVSSSRVGSTLPNVRRR